MRTECLPFTLIPHTTPLFTDLLYNYPKVQQFFPHSPDLAQWAKEEAGLIRYESGRRRNVAAILERQNRAWGASPETLKNLERLRAGACCMVTGQQVGLFGGPLYAIFKALGAIRLAEKATELGADCVPVFWLATEDHDLAEINHTRLLAGDGSLQPVATSTRGAPDAPVSEIRLGEEIREALENAETALGDSEIAGLLRRCYQPGETLGSAFARLFSALAGRWGVLMLDASDPELHALAQPIYRAAIERAEELDQALLERDRELLSSGYHDQVKVTELSTLLFTIQNGSRVVIQRANGVARAADFRIDEEKISREKLLERIDAEPQHFSANVLLRPVVQDYLLPTLAYTGGPAECAYFAQAAVVYEKLLGRVTPAVPRFSATLLEPKAASLLERYSLTLTDVFEGPERVREALAERALPADLKAAFEAAEKALDQNLARIVTSLEHLDPTLVDAAQNAGSKMHYQLDRLQGKAARAELLRNEVLDRHASLLSNLLFPHKELQEREIAGVSFLARHGMDLLERLYQAANGSCPDHQVVYL
ncbi:MAG TPA: bacillithiol biosynthesis cysteine-adding enzyme BshC [Terriglobales bacterium]|nr:bacillithiol biosynthesis cysteine-adding enzyme BshC [Terriglobales bacterium]